MKLSELRAICENLVKRAELYEGMWLAGISKEEVTTLTASLLLLVEVAEAAALKRNVIIDNEGKFDGRWVAVPEKDFDKLHDALKRLEEG